MNFLKPDSALMKTLAKMADLMLLNILTLLLCVPVITAGASFTAMHYVLLKLARNEEGYIARSFFKAFKENFVQATILWILMVDVAVVFFFDWRFLSGREGMLWLLLKYLLLALAVFVYLIMIYIFPVLSRYQNTIMGTVKTAFKVSRAGLSFLRTLGAALLFAAPFVFAWYMPFGLIPVFVVFCFSLPGYFRAKLYSGLFEQMEKS